MLLSLHQMERVDNGHNSLSVPRDQERHMSTKGMPGTRGAVDFRFHDVHRQRLCRLSPNWAVVLRIRSKAVLLPRGMPSRHERARAKKRERKTEQKNQSQNKTIHTVDGTRQGYPRLVLGQAFLLASLTGQYCDNRDSGSMRSHSECYSYVWGGGCLLAILFVVSNLTAKERTE